MIGWLAGGWLIDLIAARMLRPVDALIALLEQGMPGLVARWAAWDRQA